MRDFCHAFAKTALVTVFFLAPIFVSAATLSISPASGSYEVGERVSVKVQVSSGTSIKLPICGEKKSLGCGNSFDASRLMVVAPDTAPAKTKPNRI